MSFTFLNVCLLLFNYFNYLLLFFLFCYFFFIGNASLRHPDPHSVPVGGGSAPNSCLPTAKLNFKRRRRRRHNKHGGARCGALLVADLLAGETRPKEQAAVGEMRRQDALQRDAGQRCVFLRRTSS